MGVAHVILFTPKVQYISFGIKITNLDENHLRCITHDEKGLSLQ
jgi:hypothetical protein